MKFLFKWVGRTLLGLLAILLLLLILFFKRDIPIEVLQKKYANADSKFLPLLGMQVHYKDEGNKNDSIPLVLIHGTSSSLFTWDSATQQLITNHRVIRFDLPGYALTGPNPEGRYDVDFYNQFVDSFLILLF